MSTSSPLVFRPQLVELLLREGLLTEDDLADPSKRRVRDKINAALESYLLVRYNVPDVPDEPLPQFATGSEGEWISSQRDRPVPYYALGLVEREGTIWNWNRPPTPYLLTPREAAVRRFTLNPYDSAERVTFPGYYDFDPAEEDRADDYDPEEDIEESSFDLSDEAIEAEDG